MAPNDTTDTSSLPPVWQNIEQTIASLSGLAERETSFEVFASTVVARVSELTNAEAVVCWQIDNDQVLPIAEAGWSSISTEVETENRALIAEAIVHSSPTLKTELRGARRSHGRCAIVATYRDWRGVAGVIEVIIADLDGNSNENRLRGSERLLRIASELTERFLRHQRLRDLQTSQDRWHQFELLVTRVHGSLRMEETAFQLVNDGRVFVECDRVGLLVQFQGRLRTLAVSNVDTIERRSELIKRMKSLGSVVSKTLTWVKYRGDTAELPPQIQEALCAYADVSHAQSIDVVPLLASAPSDDDEDSVSQMPIGVIVFERFDSMPASGTDQRISQLATLATVAIRNAVDYSTLPFLGLARATRGLTTLGMSRGKRTFAILASVICALGILGMMPVPFSVDAKGQLHPIERRNLFAPRDVEVIEVLCDHDDLVQKDDVLLRLRSRELELEIQQLRGEQQTTRKQLLAVTSARFQRDLASDYRLQRQYAAEEQELQETLKSFENQLALLQLERETLTISSPIDGRVLTWNPAEQLEDRPIARGQLLLCVANTDANWEIEIQVSDTDIGWMKQRLLSGEALPVSFALAAGGEQIFSANIRSIAARSEVDLDGKAKVRVSASVDTPAQSFRSGETVFADVDCGRRPLGFVLFHRLYQTAWRWLWL